MSDHTGHTSSTIFLDVILPLAIAKTYTYRVPAEWNAEVAVGKRVVVQFGKNKIYSALISTIHHSAPVHYEAKYILNILDSSPIISPVQLEFWKWVSAYYMCNLGEVMNAALPTALKLTSETSIILNKETEIDKNELTDKEYLIVEALEMQSRIMMSDVSKILEQKTVYPIIRNLLEKKIVWVEEELEERYKPRKAVFIKLNEEYNDAGSLKILFEELERSPKQVDLLQKFIQLRKSNIDIEKKILLEESGIGASVLTTLIKKEIFYSYEKNVSRLKIDESDLLETFELSTSQQQAYDMIDASDKISLLHGVTSSGKTQVYIRQIESVIQQGKQALFLLPEIALTTQIINRLRKYFGTDIGVYHSKFNDNERVEVWNKALDGTYKVILGTRSSVFLPFKNLGLIVIDEEHEGSYKQYDPAPRYNARDSAIFLSTLYSSKVILGSATPSMESYFNAKGGKYQLVELKERFGGIQLPEIMISDLKEEIKRKKIESNFSSIMIARITEALENKEQIILFQNRRGYAPLLMCNTCGYTSKCVNCDVSLTYHKLSHDMHCHYCGYHQKMIKICPACGGSHLEMKGFGTEKIEDDLLSIFPSARIARMDLDSTRAKNAYINLLADLEDKKIDILVGTQMVAKGLDFDNVSMIGIINADTLLNYPDFRSYERSFQLMEQVSGRAGRRSKQGKVIIQTYQPEHYIIRSVIQHNYDLMYQTELAERKQFHYPPFYRLIKIDVKHKDQNTVQNAARALARELKQELPLRILGPEFPMISRIRNYYINTITVKIGKGEISAQKVKDILRKKIELINGQKEFKSAIIVCDVDPV
jgi:primosomal protein N' (replication factor Y) (superfamily II helicase)